MVGNDACDGSLHGGVQFFPACSPITRHMPAVSQGIAGADCPLMDGCASRSRGGAWAMNQAGAANLRGASLFFFFVL